MSNALSARAIEELKRDLFSQDAAVVMRALNKCREDGTRELVEPLIALYASSDDLHVQEEIQEMLSNVKISNLETVFMNALMNPENRKVRKQILSFMWNSGVEPVDNLLEITDIAITGTFEETLECLTLLDTIESMIPDEALMESIYRVREFLGNGGVKRETAALLTEYLNILEGRENQ